MADTYGLASVTWGVPTMVGFVVNSADINSKNNVEGTIEDENGNTVYRYFGDKTEEITIEVVHASGSVPQPGGTFEYSGSTWIAKEINYKYENKSGVKHTFKGIKSEFITA